MIDLKNLERESRSNSHFAAPNGWARSEPDEIAPVFSVPAARLWTLWRQLIERRPKVQIESLEEGERRSHHVEKTAVLSFPDDVHAQIVELGERESSIAILSRARIGILDLGTNRRRVTVLLRALETMASGG